jgi:hypothetical protein
MEIIASIVLVVLGLAVAFLGRKLLWLLIAAAGFILAFELTNRFLGESSISLIISIGVGLVAGYYATKFTRLLLNIAGFILVGNAALTIYGWFFSTEQFWIALLVFVVGGVIGLGLLRMTFDIAVIVISALGGAAIVAEGLPGIASFLGQPWLLTIVSIVVVVLGFLYQYRELKSESAEPSSS